MGDFRRLVVWRRAQALAAAVYRMTATLSGEERFGPAAQMRRASISVPSNLAEGCGRRSDTELRRFIRISLGSLAELECQVLLAQELRLLESRDATDTVNEIREIRGMLDQLHSRLTSRSKPRPPTDSRLQTKTLDP